MSGPRNRLPCASREQILEAVAALEHDSPVTVGRLGVRLGQMMEVDMSGMATLYGLRGLISWQSLQTTLKRLVEEGALVRRTEQDWHRVTDGRLFGQEVAASSSTWGYCTAQHAQEIRRVTLEQRTLRQSAARAEAAELLRSHPDGAQYARNVFHHRYPREFAALVKEWVRRGGVV